VVGFLSGFLGVIFP